MADLIRRSDVIGLLEDMLLFGEYDIIASAFSKADEEKAYQAINDIPAVNRWISVEDALPDSKEDVLVWFEYFRYGEYNCLYQTYGIGNYNKNYDEWMVNHETGWDQLRVIAWMPMPNAYEPPEKE